MQEWDSKEWYQEKHSKFNGIRNVKLPSFQSILERLRRSIQINKIPIANPKKPISATKSEGESIIKAYKNFFRKFETRKQQGTPREALQKCSIRVLVEWRIPEFRCGRLFAQGRDRAKREGSRKTSMGGHYKGVGNWRAFWGRGCINIMNSVFIIFRKFCHLTMNTFLVILASGKRKFSTK